MVPEPKTSPDIKGASLMDELPERLSTAEMLRAALVALLGQATVLVKMWCGWGNCRRAALPLTAGKRFGAPVNRLTAERVVGVAADVVNRGVAGAGQLV
ncbi:MAG: hypothetical protein UC328_06315 [Adlercreutzia sp.]|nr:hypothetical protein [Adlercreutzia sp.]